MACGPIKSLSKYGASGFYTLYAKCHLQIRVAQTKSLSKYGALIFHTLYTKCHLQIRLAQSTAYFDTNLEYNSTWSSFSAKLFCFLTGSREVAIEN